MVDVGDRIYAAEVRGVAVRVQSVTVTRVTKAFAWLSSRELAFGCKARLPLELVDTTSHAALVRLSEWIGARAKRARGEYDRHTRSLVCIALALEACEEADSRG